LAYAQQVLQRKKTKKRKRRKKKRKKLQLQPQHEVYEAGEVCESSLS